MTYSLIYLGESGAAKANIRLIEKSGGVHSDCNYKTESTG